MRSNLVIVLFLQFLLSSVHGFTQETDSLVVVSGQVVSIATKKTIPFAHIKVKRKGCIADSLGYYTLECNAKDSLKVSAIGYGTLEIPLILHQKNWPFLIIELQATSYQLGEVEVFAFSSYEEFKKDFIASKLPEPEFKINESIFEALSPYTKHPPNEIPPMYRTSFREKPGFWDAIGTPTDFLYYHLSRKEKSKRKVANMIRKEKKQKKIGFRYNSNLIARITNLEGEKLADFIAFCNSKIKVDTKSSDYEISSQINKLFKQYQEEKIKVKG
ncbi:MAG: carboxypeptidase-like regulatory domain-containing protein [Marinifilaceae bacterium]